MKPLIELENVTFGYGAVPVVEQVDLHIHAGQMAALVGPSGAGKTTLLKLVLGILTPAAGIVRFRGQPPERAMQRIGYVPQLQSVDWNFPVTVEQVVMMGAIGRASIWPWASASDKARLVDVLTRLEIDHLAKRHIRDLSGGQQQRVFLARALISDPELLILDEPTTGVDMRTAENILHLLADLNVNAGITLLMTTHDLNAAAAHIPWVICLNRTVIAQGSPDDIFKPEILNKTYRADMAVMRQDGLLFVHQVPHSHSHQDIIPAPVPGFNQGAQS